MKSTNRLKHLLSSREMKQVLTAYLTSLCFCTDREKSTHVASIVMTIQKVPLSMLPALGQGQKRSQVKAREP